VYNEHLLLLLLLLLLLFYKLYPNKLFKKIKRIQFISN